MYRFLRHIAVLLLLLFVRVMVPDALLLELHPHTHTVHADHTDAHEAQIGQIGQKHKHCPVEDLFGAPFQSASPLVDLTPVVHTTAYAVHYDDAWQPGTYFNTSLRGPPAA